MNDTTSTTNDTETTIQSLDDIKLPPCASWMPINTPNDCITLTIKPYKKLMIYYFFRHYYVLLYMIIVSFAIFTILMVLSLHTEDNIAIIIGALVFLAPGLASFIGAMYHFFRKTWITLLSSDTGIKVGLFQRVFSIFLNRTLDQIYVYKKKTIPDSTRGSNKKIIPANKTLYDVYISDLCIAEFLPESDANDLVEAIKIIHSEDFDPTNIQIPDRLMSEKVRLQKASSASASSPQDDFIPMS